MEMSMTKTLNGGVAGNSSRRSRTSSSHLHHRDYLIDLVGSITQTLQVGLKQTSPLRGLRDRKQYESRSEKDSLPQQHNILSHQHQKQR